METKMEIDKKNVTPASASALGQSGSTSSAGTHTKVLVDPIILHPVLEFIGHAVLVAIFGFAIAFFLKKHVVHELREGIAKMLKTISETAEEVSEIFRKAIQEDALNHFREQMRVVSDGVTHTMLQIRDELQVAVVMQKKASVTHIKVVNDALTDIEAQRFGDAETKLLNASLDNFEILKTLVRLYRNPKVKRLSDALKMLMDKNEVFKENAQFYWELAVTYTELGDQTNAIQSAHKYMDLSSPDFPWTTKANISLGYTYFWFKDVASAVVYTKKALATLVGREGDKLEFVCKGNLAYYYAQLNQNAELAIQYADYVVNSDGDDAYHFDTRGYVRMQFAAGDKAELEKAQKDFILAAEKDPSLSLAYTHLAEVNLKLKELTQKKE